MRIVSTEQAFTLLLRTSPFRIINHHASKFIEWVDACQLKILGEVSNNKMEIKYKSVYAKCQFTHLVGAQGTSVYISLVRSMIQAMYFLEIKQTVSLIRTLGTFISSLPFLKKRTVLNLKLIINIIVLKKYESYQNKHLLE